MEQRDSLRHWVIAREFQGSGGNVEPLALEILKDALDFFAPIGKVFFFSVTYDVSVVEKAFSRLI